MIKLDFATNGAFVNPTTSITWQHTCSGKNRLLIVGCFGSGADQITSITYNGIAMQRVDLIQQPSDRFMYIYTLINPPEGAHDVVVSASASIAISGKSVSYTGVRPYPLVDVKVKGTLTGQIAFSQTLTPTKKNCWTFLIVKTGSASQIRAKTGCVMRASGNDLGLFDSNGVIDPIAPKTMEVERGAGNASNWGGIMISFAPVNAPFPTNNPT